MGFKKVDVVYKKQKGEYTLRLATEEESNTNKLAETPVWKLTEEQRVLKKLVKKVRGFDDCVLYPPEYELNTVFVQGDKVLMEVNYKTNKGKIFIKGMNGSNGFLGRHLLTLYGIEYDFNKSPEIVQEILKQLPEKGKLHDTGKGIVVQY
jgi:hypothetical protein